MQQEQRGPRSADACEAARLGGLDLGRGEAIHHALVLSFPGGTRRNQPPTWLWEASAPRWSASAPSTAWTSSSTSKGFRTTNATPAALASSSSSGHPLTTP